MRLVSEGLIVASSSSDLAEINLQLFDEKCGLTVAAIINLLRS
jgi:hypothetical protein